METLEQYINLVISRLIEENRSKISIEIADSAEEDFISLRIIAENCDDISEYKHSHEKGDLPTYFSNLFCKNPNINITLKFISDEDYFELNTLDVKDVFAGMKIDSEEAISGLKDFIEEAISN